MHTTASPLPAPETCFNVATPEGYKAFSDAQFESQHEAHAKAAQERARAAVLWFASASDPEPLTEAERGEIDDAVERWKDSGGPDRDHDARAVAIELGSRRFS